MSEDEDLSISTQSNSYSPQQRKAFYRRNLREARVLRENVNKQTITTIQDLMVETDTINADETFIEKVNHTDEILLDSEMLKVSSEVLKRCTDTLTKKTSPYNPIEFADKILSFMQMQPDMVLEEPHWPGLADTVLKCINITPHYSYLLGTLKPLEKKQSVRRKRAPRDAQVATIKPENVHTVDKVEDGVEETVQKIKALVSQYYKRNSELLDFFKLVLNPVDFGRTVENMLHVSFLVRDGYFKLVKDDQGRLIVQTTTKEALALAKKRGNDANIQNVMSLSAQQWVALKKAYKLKEAMINFGTSGCT